MVLVKNSRASQFPWVDEFVRSIIGREGYVRSVAHFADSDTLVYSIGGNYRYCANVGRHHKSNGVYFVASLASRTMRQKCYDPDCRGFQSEALGIPDPYLLPDEVLAQIKLE